MIISKKILTLSAAIIFCVSLNGFTQIRFEPGYFIDNNDEKITCLIKNVQWLNNPQEFKYKLTDDGAEMSAGIKEVKEFATSVSKYVRAEVEIDTSNMNLDELNYNRNPLWANKVLFLLCVVEGKASLFHYRSRKLEKFFFSVDGSPIEQLIFKRYLQTREQAINNQTHRQQMAVLKNLTYLQQLKVRVTCDEVSDSQLVKLDYDLPALTRHFRNYNVCNGQAEVDVGPTHKTQVSINSGVDFQNFHVDNGFGFDFNKKFPNGKALRLGISIEYILPFNTNRWMILFEPTFQSYKNKTGIPVKYSSIEFAAGPRHNFFLGNTTKVFINALIVADIPLKYEVQWSPSRILNGKDLSASFAVGGGVVIKRVSMEVRKHFSRGILADDGSGYFLVYNKFSAIVGYRIFNKR